MDTQYTLHHWQCASAASDAPPTADQTLEFKGETREMSRAAGISRSQSCTRISAGGGVYCVQHHMTGGVVLHHMTGGGVLHHMIGGGVLHHMTGGGVLHHMTGGGVLHHMIGGGVLHHMTGGGVLHHMTGGGVLHHMIRGCICGVVCVCSVYMCGMRMYGVWGCG